MIKVLGEIELPDTLYKYRDWSLKNHKRFLTKQEAYFASPSDFNDPFDCKIPIRYDINSEKHLEDIYYNMVKAVHQNATDEEVRDFAKKHVKEGPVSPDQFKKNGTEYFQNLNRRMGVFSLSACNNDILMWGHYANSHRGFCVGLDTGELMKTEGVDFIGKVQYCPVFPIIVPVGSIEDDFHKQIFSKWDKWEYESEFRLTKNHISNRRIKFPKSAFKEIILGSNMTINERQSLIKMTNKLMPGVKIYEARPHQEKFLIEINPL